MYRKNVETILKAEYTRRYLEKKNLIKLAISYLVFIISAMLIILFLIRPNLQEGNFLQYLLLGAVPVFLFYIYNKIVINITSRKHYKEANQYLDTLLEASIEEEELDAFAEDYLKRNNTSFSELTKEQENLLKEEYINSIIPYAYREAQPETAAKIWEELNLK